MSADELSEAHEWRHRAQRDLLAAERSLSGDIALGEIAAYHAQHAAEKSLKSFLVAHGQPFPRTHDLVPLLQQCITIDEDFRELALVVVTLTPYATRFRYPGGLSEPDTNEAGDAVTNATAMVNKVAELLATDES